MKIFRMDTAPISSDYKNAADKIADGPELMRGQRKYNLYCSYFSRNAAR